MIQILFCEVFCSCWIGHFATSLLYIIKNLRGNEGKRTVVKCVGAHKRVCAPAALSLLIRRHFAVFRNFNIFNSAKSSFLLLETSQNFICDSAKSNSLGDD